VHKLHIQNETVRKNVALIVDTIRQQRKLPQRQSEQQQKTLEFIMDLKTGEFKTTSSAGKSIEIHLDLDNSQVQVTEKQDGRQFNLEEMDPKGRRVLSETCHYLKAALSHLHDIHELAHLEFEPSVQEIVGRNLLQEAWHAVQREDAELMLLNTSPGTYLFRKDHFASVMEEVISRSKKSQVRCFTLSYLDPEAQVRDRTIVTWKDHWLFYDDDPTLSGRHFESLEDLLSSMGTVLKRPLPALRSRRTA
jgi:hypothetical protein